MRRAFVYVTLLLLWCFACSRFDPGKDRGGDTARTSLVKIELFVTGTDPSGTATPQIVAATIKVTGCTSGQEESFDFTDMSVELLLNLTEGDENCKLVVSKLSYDNGVTQSYEAVDTPIDSTSTGIAIYQNKEGNSKIELAVGKSISAKLEHTEYQSFYVLPPKTVLGELAYDSTEDVASGSDPVPAVTLSRFTDYGVQSSSGKREVEVVVECIEPLAIYSCRGQSILDYRMRIVDYDTATLTKSAFDGYLSDILTAVRPTEGHFYGNGFHVLQTFEPTDPDTKRYVLIMKYKESYRYFVFTPQRFLTASQ